MSLTKSAHRDANKDLIIFNPMNVPSFFIFLITLLFMTSGHAAQVYRTGNTEDIQRATGMVNCFAGGGSDDAWAAGWKLMLKEANGGDVVIIRADGRRGGYENWIFGDTDKHGFANVNSVTTIDLNDISDGEDRALVNIINNAEMIFFAGGDQARYFRFIKGSSLHKALRQAMHGRHIPFGGTSAGAAIMGDISYRAFNRPADDLVTADNVMNQPTAPFVDLDRDFLSPAFMTKVIVDTHFAQRNRQGRLVGFMARAVHNNYENINALNIRAIGIDEETAVCYGQSGQAKVFGNNNAYFLDGNSLIERIEDGLPLNWLGNHQAVKVYEIHGGNVPAGFDLKTWQGSGGREQYWHVDGTDPQNVFWGQSN